MKSIQKWLPYSLLFLVIYYGMPLLPGMGQDSYGRLLQLYTPMLCMILGLVYGIRVEFNLLFSLLAAVLFMPAVWLYYDITSWIYAIVYLAMTFIGTLPGLIKELEETE